MYCEEADHIIQAFRSWDESGSGIISRHDLASIIRALSPGIAERDLDRLFKAAARDGFQAEDLKYEDFVTWLWHPSNLATLEVAEEAAAAAAAEEKGRAAAAAEEQAKKNVLWKGTLAAATAKAQERYPEEKVHQYWDDVSDRLYSQDYAKHVRSTFFDKVDTDRDGMITFRQVLPVIRKCLQCAADMEHRPRPTKQEMRAAFDAHDGGKGVMGEEEFLNLMRYLQIKVAEAVMPMSRVFRDA